MARSHVDKMTAAAVMFALSACSHQAPVLDLHSLSASERNAALGVRSYMAKTEGTPPDVDQVLQYVQAYACKTLITGPPPSREDALLQLQVKASRIGADAILDVEFNEGGTKDLGTSCWETLQAKGIAVKLKGD